MLVFVLLHVLLTVIFFVQLFKWRKTPFYNNLMEDPLRNVAILTPFISIIMTMNVFIGPIRFFVPWLGANLQTLMLPALIFWILIGIFLMKTVISLLKTSFVKSFDVNKIHFGWILHPFDLGMYTVIGTGIAALSKEADIAHIAIFISFIFGSMGLFLLMVKLFVIFKSHFASQFFP